MKYSTLFIVVLIALMNMPSGLNAMPAAELPDKLCICPKLYKPVCATNNKTYSNLCLMDCDKGLTKDLTLKREGRCQSDDDNADDNFPSIQSIVKEIAVAE